MFLGVWEWLWFLFPLRESDPVDAVGVCEHLGLCLQPGTRHGTRSKGSHWNSDAELGLDDALGQSYPLVN